MAGGAPHGGPVFHWRPRVGRKALPRPVPGKRFLSPPFLSAREEARRPSRSQRAASESLGRRSVRPLAPRLNPTAPGTPRPSPGPARLPATGKRGRRGGGRRPSRAAGLSPWGHALSPPAGATPTPTAAERAPCPRAGARGRPGKFGGASWPRAGSLWLSRPPGKGTRKQRGCATEQAPPDSEPLSRGGGGDRSGEDSSR